VGCGSFAADEGSDCCDEAVESVVRLVRLPGGQVGSLDSAIRQRYHDVVHEHRQQNAPIQTLPGLGAHPSESTDVRVQTATTELHASAPPR
jgi:hypothetical protein